MEMKSINQEEGLAEVINWIKDLTAKIETQLGYIARGEPD
jgi:hypothetical protein